MDRIKSLPRRVAHTVLLAICNDPSTLRRAIDMVDLLEAPESPDADYSEDEVKIVGVAPTQDRKRKTPPSADITVAVPDAFRCEVCEEMFVARSNSHNACRYHEGELEPDLECGLWDAYVEEPAVWGDIDTAENIRQHPEGFYWDCCGKRADDRGCQADYHKSPNLPGSSAAKRSRLDGDVDGGQAAYSNDPIDVRDDDGDDDGGDDDGDDDDSVVEVSAPLVTIDDDIDEDPPEELEDEVEFGAGLGNAEVVVKATAGLEVEKVAAVSDNDSPKAKDGVQAEGRRIADAEELETLQETSDLLRRNHNWRRAGYTPQGQRIARH